MTKKKPTKPKSRPRKPPPHGKRTRAVSQAILEQLVRSGARPGDKLPTEHELARDFGVSRPTARQALQALTYAGLIEAKPRRGTRLKAPDPGALAPFFGAHLALAAAEAEKGGSGDETLQALAEARRVLELALIPLAAKRRTAADLKALEKAETQMAAVPHGDRPARVAADADFHRALIRCAHNPVLTGLAQLSDGYFGMHSQMPTEAAKDITPPLARRTLTEHRAIRKALEARDAVEAARVLAKHLEPTVRGTRARR